MKIKVLDALLKHTHPYPGVRGGGNPSVPYAKQWVLSFLKLKKIHEDKIKSNI